MIEIIQTNNAPEAIGPYSQAIKLGNLLFTSGQIPIVPESGEIISESIELATERVFLNLEGILKEAGSSFSSVVKTTVYLKDMMDFPKVNEVYESYFPCKKPARSCVQVSRLPKDALIEIELIAVIGENE